MAPNGLVRPIEKTARCTYQRQQATDSVRLAWENLLSDVGANGIMITLGFRTYLDKVRAVKIANHFLLRLNRHLYGKRFRKNCQSLTGMVALELKHHSSRSLNSPHFHFVVSAASLAKSIITEDKLCAIVNHAAGRLCLPTLDRYRPLGPPVSGPEFVHVTKIYGADELSNYLTKDCKSFGPVNDARNIGFFDANGIVGI